MQDPEDTKTKSGCPWLGEEGTGRNCLVDIGFPFGIMKCFGTR